MYQERSSKRPKIGPCRDKDDARRSEYKRRADELKNELRNQRIAMRKMPGQRGYVTGPKTSSTMVSPDGYCLKPCTKPKPTFRSSQSRSKSRPRMRAYETSESEPVPKPKTKKKPVSTILEECEPLTTPRRPGASSAPSTSSRMFSPKRPQQSRKKKDPIDDVLRSEVDCEEYRASLDDDCLPTRGEYKQPGPKRPQTSRKKKDPIDDVLRSEVDCEEYRASLDDDCLPTRGEYKQPGPKRPQTSRKKKDPIDDVLRSEVDCEEYRAFLDDDCLPTRDEYKQPKADKSLRRLEELVGKIEKTERRILNIQSQIPRKSREKKDDSCEDPIKPQKKRVPKSVVCAEKETVRTPLENSNVPDDVVIKTAENLLHRMVRPFVSDVVHRMFKTCLEWALCKHPTEGSSRLDRIVKALLHFQDEVQRHNTSASTTERVIIKPGEINPESITIINVKRQEEKKKRSDYTLGENQELDYCDSSPSESLISDLNTSLSDSELAWLNCLEDSKSKYDDFDFERPAKKEKEFFFPETRLVNAVPNRQNPNVAELDMENVLVIRNPERYLEPDYSK